MNVQFFGGGDRKKLLQELNEKYGIVDPGFLFLETGKQKIRAFSGSMNRDEIVHLSENVRIELIGTYFAREDEMIGLRLSFDAPYLKGVEVSKGIAELTDEEVELWMRGDSLIKEIPLGVYVMKHNEDFLGCGYSTGKKILNYIPRERQNRSKLNSSKKIV